uniref:F-box/LRR-repeat protein 15/At3g58940/PEG3-like LRR domain-containing protein n=1 Tax=Setaria viridis TaxID=4556 RepID=A0A4U6VXS7_SETVI|nr:hypothetical protein SEVIR_3G419701v2 [Setaria viridis]
MFLDSSCYNNGLSLEAGNSLVKASISVMPEQLSPRTEAILLGSLFSVTSLELQFFQAMAFLDNELDKFPMFDNLRTLSLSYCFFSERDADKLKALGRFLHKSPNLEELILQDFWVLQRIRGWGKRVTSPSLKRSQKFPCVGKERPS